MLWFKFIFGLNFFLPRRSLIDCGRAKTGPQTGGGVVSGMLLIGLQRYTGAPVNRDIFCHDTNIDI